GSSGDGTLIASALCPTMMQTRHNNEAAEEVRADAGCPWNKCCRQGNSSIERIVTNSLSTVHEYHRDPTAALPALPYLFAHTVRGRCREFPSPLSACGDGEVAVCASDCAAILA